VVSKPETGSTEEGTCVLKRWELAIDGLAAGSEGSGLRSVEKKVLSSDHGRLGERLVLLGETPWVPRDQAGPPDVTELQHQHDDTLEANASSTVGRATPFEAIEVVDHRLRVNLGLPHLLFEEDRIVDTLTPRKDLLTTNKDIVGVGQLRVLRIRHSIEGPGTGGELVYWDQIRRGGHGDS